MKIAPSMNFLHLMVSKIQPRQNFKGQGHYSKGQRSDQIVHLQPLTNVPVKYQPPTPYGF